MLGAGTALWTAPQIVKAEPAGADTTYNITVSTLCVVSPAVPFSVSCPANPATGGTFQITTPGCTFNSGQTICR